jgi:DNA-binding Lrp family transcriptional regulator
MSYKNLISLTFDNNKVPVFIEQKGKDWVKYGESNNYPQYLVLLFNRSAKHNAIITSKQLYISGKGVEIDQTDMQGDDIVKLQAYINAPNQYETLNDLMKKTVLDYELFGGFYLKVVGKKGKDGVAEIYHVDYCNVRSNEDNTEFYLSSEWINEQGDENSNPKDIKTLPAYDINKKQAESLFYLKAYRPNLNTYTLPDYIGAVPAIITDAEIANYHRAEIQNSFKGSKMITFVNGIPSDDEMKATERKLKSKFTSTDSSGSIVVDFADDKDRAAIIQDLSAGDFADKYNALNNTIQQEIFVGHKITSPMIFGVRVEGQLGGRSEMIDAFNLFTNTYVEPRQQVQERVYDLFAPVKGKIKIKPIEPIMASFSEQTLMQILTKDEMREVIGRKALEPSQVVAVPQVPQVAKFSKETRDLIDYETFAKYGELIENFQSIKRKKIMFSKQDFALDKIDEAVLDLIRKTPKIDVDAIAKVLKIDKTKATDIIETLIAEELIDRNLKVTNIGKEYKTPSFTELVIRYKYALRSDAPALIEGGESRDFCKAMMSNPRYFSREDINNIGNELGQLYGIPNYDAFRRRGGWYHDPIKDVNLPFCRHVWEQELVKRIK